MITTQAQASHEHAYDDATGEKCVCPVNGCWFNAEDECVICVPGQCPGRDCPGNKNRPEPVDPETFRRTAPQWNCVDYPGDGPHYTPGTGRCEWCGMTQAQIAAEWDARERSDG